MRSNEDYVAIVNPATVFRRDVARVRKELQKLDNMPQFRFRMEAQGRVHDGEVKVVYSIADNEYGTNEVEGDSVDAVVEEALRRKGWAKTHAPLALSFKKSDTDDAAPPPANPGEEIPF